MLFLFHKYRKQDAEVGSDLAIVNQLIFNQTRQTQGYSSWQTFFPIGSLHLLGYKSRYIFIPAVAKDFRVVDILLEKYQRCGYESRGVAPRWLSQLSI